MEINEKDWEKRRIEREVETMQLERLAIGREKQEKIKMKVKERNLQKEIDNSMTQLPKTEPDRIEEKRKNKLDIIEMKKSLWRLRNKEKKHDRKPEKLIKLENIEKMEEKLTKIKTLKKELKKIRNEI